MEIHLHLKQRLLGRHLQPRLPDLDGGIGNENVGRADRGGCSPHDTACRTGLSQIAGHRCAALRQCAHFFQRAIERLARAHAVHSHRRAIFRQRTRDGPSDSACGAGHQRPSAFQ